MITNDLTKEQAETRKDRIENIKYQITLYLNPLFFYVAYPCFCIGTIIITL